MTGNGVPAENLNAEENNKTVQPSIDRLSLAQALQDFEIANKRVLDLTQRLTTLSQEHIKIRTEATALRMQNADLKNKLRDAEAMLRNAEAQTASRSRHVEAELRGTLEQVRASRAVGVAKLFSRKLRSALQ